MRYKRLRNDTKKVWRLYLSAQNVKTMGRGTPNCWAFFIQIWASLFHLPPPPPPAIDGGGWAEGVVDKLISFFGHILSLFPGNNGHRRCVPLFLSCIASI